MNARAFQVGGRRCNLRVETAVNARDFAFGAMGGLYVTIDTAFLLVASHAAIAGLGEQRQSLLWCAAGVVLLASLFSSQLSRRIAGHDRRAFATGRNLVRSGIAIALMLAALNIGTASSAGELAIVCAAYLSWISVLSYMSGYTGWKAVLSASGVTLITLIVMSAIGMQMPYSEFARELLTYVVVISAVCVGTGYVFRQASKLDVRHETPRALS